MLSGVFSGQLLISGSEVRVLHGRQEPGARMPNGQAKDRVLSVNGFAAASEPGDASPDPPCRDPAPMRENPPDDGGIV